MWTAPQFHIASNGLSVTRARVAGTTAAAYAAELGGAITLGPDPAEPSPEPIRRRQSGPSSAALAVQSAAEFLQAAQLAGRQPTPAQLAAFLHKLVGQVSACKGSGLRWSDYQTAMANIGWDNARNCPVGKSVILARSRAAGCSLSTKPPANCALCVVQPPQVATVLAAFENLLGTASGLPVEQGLAAMGTDLGDMLNHMRATAD